MDPSNTFNEFLDIQEQILEDIFDNRIIQIEGKNGSGKTYLVKNILDEIKKWENWSCYYFCGVSPDIEPYATICNTPYANNKINSISEISFNISGVSFLGMSLSANRNKKTGFSPYDYTLVDKLLQDSEENLLIIADDYHLWDTQSAKLLNTLILSPNLFIRNQKQLHAIIVTEESHNEVHEYFRRSIGRFPTYILHCLDAKGIKAYLNEYGKEKKFEEISDDTVDFIKNLTGGNMNMVKLILDSCINEINLLTKEDNNRKIITELATDRIKNFNQLLKLEMGVDTQEILSIASLFEKYFTLEELSFVSEQNTNLILKILIAAQHDDFIKDIPPYVFSCLPIKNVLRQNLKEKQIFYYKRLYDLLCEKMPENYYRRAECLSKFKVGSSGVIYLYALSYSRYLLKYNDEKMCKNIIESVRAYVEKNNHLTSINEAFYNFSIFTEILNCTQAHDYSIAFEKIKDVRRTTNFLFESEIASISLGCLVLISNSTNKIRELTEEFLDVLDIVKEHKEFEQYVSMLLIVLPIILDKLNNVELFNELRKELNRTIMENNENKYLRYAQATLQRKSSLYKSYDTAYIDTAQAIHFFSENNMVLETYFSLCNHSGNLLVRNDYKAALKSAQEAMKLQETCSRFCSKEKVFNNYVLASLLQSEDYYLQKQLTQQQLKAKIIHCIQQLSGNVTGDNDASIVMLINQSSLYAYIGDFEKSQLLIAKIRERLLDNEDDFYTYFINNIELGIAISTQEWSTAQSLLANLNSFIPALFYKSERLIIKRCEIIKKIIENKECYTSIEYNFSINGKLNRFSDASWKYFSRGFPISDLQFNSQ